MTQEQGTLVHIVVVLYWRVLAGRPIVAMVQMRRDCIHAVYHIWICLLVRWPATWLRCFIILCTGCQAHCRAGQTSDTHFTTNCWKCKRTESMKTPTQHGTPGSSSASSSSGDQFGACHRLLPYVFTNDSAFSTSASETKGGCRYDVEELFHKKKNTKSTEASYTIRYYTTACNHELCYCNDRILNRWRRYLWMNTNKAAFQPQHTQSKYLVIPQCTNVLASRLCYSLAYETCNCAMHHTHHCNSHICACTFT